MPFIATALTTFLSGIFLNKLFRFLRLNKRNYRGKYIPFAGGTIIYINISLGFIFLFFFGEVSFVKAVFFLVVLTLIYMIGLLDDLLGTAEIKGLRANINALFSKRLSTGIIKAIFITLLSCYIYYFFNEEYWTIKGIITALTANLFNLLDLRPGRCIKAIYPFLFLFSFSNIRWTMELHLIFSIVLAIYYFWDAYGGSMLGDSGSNLAGFITGLILCEVIGTNFIALAVLLCLLVLFQIFLDKYSLTDIIKNSPLLDYIDRFLTERQAMGNVEPGKRKSY